MKDGIGAPGREDIAGQEENGDAIRRRDRRARHEIRGAWSDRRRARKRAQSIRHPGVTHGGVHHCLLVAREVVRELFTAFEECFAEAGDVAVAEDAKTSREEAIRLAVAFH